MDQLLGGGLAIAAGDGDERDRKLPAVVQGQVLQGLEDVGNEDEACVGGPGWRLIDNGIGCSELEGADGESIPVKVGAFQRKVEIAFFQAAGICLDGWVLKEQLV